MNRRQFLSRSICAAVSGSAAMRTVFQLSTMGRAVACTPFTGADDYKALVCVFLKGGNDSNNMIIPVTGPNYGHYSDYRGDLEVPLDDVLPLDTPVDIHGSTYGFHPELDAWAAGDGLLQRWAEGKLAVVANVGSLVEPTTKSAIIAGTAVLPPQLFSHSDQQVQWQSSRPDAPFQTGWAGRIADYMRTCYEVAGPTISMTITVAGANSLQVGADTNAYAVGLHGSIPFSGFGDYVGTPATGAAAVRLAALREIALLPHGHHFKDRYTSVLKGADEAHLAISGALSGFDELAAPYSWFGTGKLSQQLRMVARMIAARGLLSQRRQIFFCELDGFDTHQEQPLGHPALLAELNEALDTFQRAMEELTISDSVTLFTASDFSRTLTPNGSDPMDETAAGSDHAWGGHQLVLGGAVAGGQIYGQMPLLQPNGLDDVEWTGGRGRWIPTLSVDQYAAPLARWFGVPEEDIDSIFPNLAAFAAEPPLAFIA